MIFTRSSGTACHAAEPRPRSPGPFVPCHPCNVILWLGHRLLRGTHSASWLFLFSDKFSDVDRPKQLPLCCHAERLPVWSTHAYVVCHNVGWKSFGALSSAGCCLAGISMTVRFDIQAKPCSCTRALDAYLAKCAPSVQTPLLLSGSISAFTLWTKRQSWDRERRCYSISVCWNTLPVVLLNALHYSSERLKNGVAIVGPI